MIIINDEMTVGELRRLEKDNPQIPQTMRRAKASSYEEFIDVLYVELDTIIRDLENDANLSQHFTENNFNADICRQLRRLTYDAVHDKNNRGHADITVNYGKYTWIGEGKKVDSVDNTHLTNGYDQLVHRYMVGKANANQGALLVYILGNKPKHVITSWRNHLITKNTSLNGYAANITSCSENPDHVFWSEHTDHASSGSLLKIKHIGLVLHWAPP